MLNCSAQCSVEAYIYAPRPRLSCVNSLILPATTHSDTHKVLYATQWTLSPSFHSRKHLTRSRMRPRGQKFQLTKSSRRNYRIGITALLHEWPYLLIAQYLDCEAALKSSHSLLYRAHSSIPPAFRSTLHHSCPHSFDGH